MKDLYDLSGDYEELKTIYRIRTVCENIISWMLNEKCSIRMCANELGYSKSLVHSYIHSYIRVFYDEAYDQIVKLLKWNKTYRSRPRKYWRGLPW